VITSDNDDNIKGGIFQEPIAACEAAELVGRPFPGRITLESKWHAGPNTQTLTAFGCKPPQSHRLQGFHRKYLLCIVDDCCGVPAELWEAAESLASNAAGLVVAVETRQTRHRTLQRCASPDRDGKCSRSARTTPPRTRVSRCVSRSREPCRSRVGQEEKIRFGERRTLAISPACLAISRRPHSSSRSG
jgi:hypothetical protein